MGLLDRFSERVEDFLGEVFIPEKLRSLLERASKLIENGNYDQALRLLEEARGEHEDHHRTFHLLGLCHYFREDYGAALEQLEHAIELRDEPATRLYAGLTAEQLGAARDAKLHFQAALRSAEQPPFAFDLRFGHGRVLLALDRPEKAIHELRKAAERRPDHPKVAVELARALFEAGDVEAADDKLEGVSDAELGSEGRRLLADVAEARGEAARAAEIFETLVDDAPDDTAAAVGAARNHLAAGAPARAQRHLLRAADEATDDALRLEARTLLARAQETVGNAERAREQFAAAVRELEETGAADRRTAAEARMGLGRTTLETGDTEAAARHFEALASSAPPPFRNRARLGLAHCRIERGSYSEGRRLLDDIDEDAFDGERRAERCLLAGRAALGSGDAAEALVEFQEGLRWASTPDGTSDLRSARDDALRELQPAWDLPESLDGPVAAERAVDATRAFLETSPHLESFRPRARHLAERLSQPLSVAIVGEFNAGKSTLVNALLGEEVVPTGILPTTAHTCYIRYGPRKTARVHYRDPLPDDGSTAAEAGEVVEVHFEEARRRMEEETEAIDHLEFLYPHPQLRSIHFRDTPGFNAMAGDDEIASEALDDAEAVLWVFDAGQTLSRTELDRLRDIPDGADRLVVLLNKVDELRSEDIDELEDYIDETIGTEVAGQFSVSARDAFRAATGHDGAPDDAPTRFATFREFLDRRFVQRAGHIKTLEVGRRLVELVDDLEQRIERLDDRYRTWRERAAEIADWVDDQFETRHEETVEHEADTVADQFQFAVTAVARDIREDLRPRGTFFTRLVLDDEDRAFALDLLGERLLDILDRSEERVRSDVGAFENELGARLGAILDALPVADARTLQRRLEGLDDECDALRQLLTERVYGQLAAELRGRIDAAGPALLSDVETDDPEELDPWRRPLEALLPDPANHVDEHLTDWYREFFVAARRFTHRVEQDLELLRLEIQHRYDLAPLRDLVSEP